MSKPSVGRVLSFTRSKHVTQVLISVPGHPDFKGKPGMMMIDNDDADKSNFLLFSPSMRYYYHLCRKNGSKSYVSKPLKAKNVGPMVLGNPEKHLQTIRKAQPITVNLSKIFQ